MHPFLHQRSPGLRGTCSTKNTHETNSHVKQPFKHFNKRNISGRGKDMMCQPCQLMMAETRSLTSEFTRSLALAPPQRIAETVKQQVSRTDPPLHRPATRSGRLLSARLQTMHPVTPQYRSPAIGQETRHPKRPKVSRSAHRGKTRFVAHIDNSMNISDAWYTSNDGNKLDAISTVVSEDITQHYVNDSSRVSSDGDSPVFQINDCVTSSMIDVTRGGLDPLADYDTPITESSCLFHKPHSPPKENIRDSAATRSHLKRQALSADYSSMKKPWVFYKEDEKSKSAKVTHRPFNLFSAYRSHSADDGGHLRQTKVDNGGISDNRDMAGRLNSADCEPIRGNSQDRHGWNVGQDGGEAGINDVTSHCKPFRLSIDLPHQSDEDDDDDDDGTVDASVRFGNSGTALESSAQAEGFTSKGDKNSGGVSHGNGNNGRKELTIPGCQWDSDFCSIGNVVKSRELYGGWRDTNNNYCSRDGNDEHMQPKCDDDGDGDDGDGGDDSRSIENAHKGDACKTMEHEMTQLQKFIENYKMYCVNNTQNANNSQSHQTTNVKDSFCQSISQHNTKVFYDRNFINNALLNNEKSASYVINNYVLHDCNNAFHDISNNSLSDINNDSLSDINNNALSDINNNALSDINNNALSDINNNALSDINNNALSDINNNALSDINNNALSDINNNANCNEGANSSTDKKIDKMSLFSESSSRNNSMVGRTSLQSRFSVDESFDLLNFEINKAFREIVRNLRANLDITNMVIGDFPVIDFDKPLRTDKFKPVKQHSMSSRRHSSLRVCSRQHSDQLELPGPVKQNSMSSRRHSSLRVCSRQHSDQLELPQPVVHDLDSSRRYSSVLVCSVPQQLEQPQSVENDSKASSRHSSLRVHSDHQQIDKLEQLQAVENDSKASSQHSSLHIHREPQETIKFEQSTQPQPFKQDISRRQNVYVLGIAGGCYSDYLMGSTQLNNHGRHRDVGSKTSKMQKQRYRFKFNSKGELSIREIYSDQEIENDFYITDKNDPINDSDKLIQLFSSTGLCDKDSFDILYPPLLQTFNNGIGHEEKVVLTDDDEIRFRVGRIHKILSRLDSVVLTGSECAPSFLEDGSELRAAGVTRKNKRMLKGRGKHRKGHNRDSAAGSKKSDEVPEIPDMFYVDGEPLTCMFDEIEENLDNIHEQLSHVDSQRCVDCREKTNPATVELDDERSAISVDVADDQYVVQPLGSPYRNWNSIQKDNKKLWDDIGLHAHSVRSRKGPVCMPLCFTPNALPLPGYIYYFAYGTHMNKHRLRTYLSREVTPRLWGLLFGFELVFNKIGLDLAAGRQPNLMYSPRKSAEGCLYLISVRESHLLDRFIGHPKHFEKVMLPVWLLNCDQPDAHGVAQFCVPAVTYIAHDSWICYDTSVSVDASLNECLASSDLLTPAYRRHLIRAAS